MSFLLTPLQYEFMQRGMIAAVLVGIVCAVVGTYVVLRGMAFFGDAVAHTILPGIALGYLFSGGARDVLFWWALGTAIVAALGIGAISKNSEIKEDTAIGIIFAGMFALGIALISTVRSYAVDLSHFLFGDVLSVSTHSLWLILIFGGLVLLTIFAFYKEFTTLSFDPILAATLRLPVGLLNNLLLALIAVTVAVSLQTVGVALMVAMLVTPAGDGKFAHASFIHDDDPCRDLCFFIRSDRLIYFVLSKYRLRCSDRIDRDDILYGCICVERR